MKLYFHNTYEYAVFKKEINDICNESSPDDVFIEEHFTLINKRTGYKYTIHYINYSSTYNSDDPIYICVRKFFKWFGFIHPHIIKKELDALEKMKAFW